LKLNFYNAEHVPSVHRVHLLVTCDYRKKMFALTKLVFVIEGLNISSELDVIGFINLRKFQTTDTHQITQYNLNDKILGQFICDESVPI